MSSDGFTPLLSPVELKRIVARLGAEISRDYSEGVLCIGVLKGCVLFFADLVRELQVDCSVDFLALSAYRPGETRVRILKDLETDVTARRVLVIEDVIDTGLSASYVSDLLVQRGAHDVELCTLLDRPSRRILPVSAHYVGLSIHDPFLVGYGLDFAERYRNLPTLHTAARHDLEANLDRYIG